MSMKKDYSLHCQNPFCSGYLILLQKKEEITLENESDIIKKDESLYVCSKCDRKVYPSELEIIR